MPVFYGAFLLQYKLKNLEGVDDVKIVVAMYVRESDKKVLEAAAPGAVFHYGKEVEALKEADVIIGNVAPSLLRDLPKLQWLQLNSAGADAYCKPGVLGEQVLLTNSTGAYGQAVSEHMLAMLLSLVKKLNRYEKNQARHLWQDEGEVRSLTELTIAIMGFGDIGREFGKLCKLLGAHVIGVRRHKASIPPEADEMATMDQLGDVLSRVDVVASVLPSTPATTGLYNADFFAAMKAGSYFINCGRGTAVNQTDLRAALESGKLTGAALDVATPEPLPAEDPLWEAPHLILTPHISGDYHLSATWDRVVAMAAENLKRYQAGEVLQNLVDRKTGYKKTE